MREAQARYRQGDEAFRAGRYDQAYQEFEAGFALVPRPLFVLNMAHAQRRRGELRSALALYRRYAAMDPESKLRDEVSGVIAELDAAVKAEDAVQRPVVAEPPAPTDGDVRVVAAPIEPPPRPLYRRWWFWGGVGAVVVGAVAAGILLSRGDGYSERGSLGRLGQP